jgi:hypothetical protein
MSGPASALPYYDYSILLNPSIASTPINRRSSTQPQHQREHERRHTKTAADRRFRQSQQSRPFIPRLTRRNPQQDLWRHPSLSKEPRRYRGLLPDSACLSRKP